MLDYTTIMIARIEHEQLSRISTPEYSLRPAQNGLLRRACIGLGAVLIGVGERLRAQGEARVDPAPVEA
jgi:hypothetical protein